MMFLRALRPLALDFLSTLVFLVAVMVWNDIRLAIVAGVVVGLAAIAWEYARGRKPGVMQWMGVALVLVTGAASLLTNDPRFVMVKPTLVYIAVGCVMLVPGWMIRYVPPRGIERLGTEIFRTWGYVWAGLMFVSAAVNLGMALATDAATWALVMSIYGPVSKFGLFLVQYAMIRGKARRLSLSSEPSAAESASLARAP